MLCCPGASISQSETEEGKTNRKLLLVVESSVWLAVAAGAERRHGFRVVGENPSVIQFQCI
jgi:hypothetical protein